MRTAVLPAAGVRLDPSPAAAPPPSPAPGPGPFPGPVTIRISPSNYSGGPRISKRRAPIPEFGTKIYYLARGTIVSEIVVVLVNRA